MTEAAQAVVDFGFSVLGARAIEARHATWNHPSRRVLERIGMIQMEYIAHGFQKHGAWVPEYRMLIENKRSVPNEPPLQTPASGTAAAASTVEATEARGAPVAPPSGVTGR